MTPLRTMVALMIIVMCLMLAAVCTGETGRANLTNRTEISGEYPEELFITIDPIGNHTIGDVFFINGTTNLPVSEHLTMDIVDYDWFERPKSKSEPNHPASGKYAYNIYINSIASASPGVNRWSATVTDLVKELRSAEYLVFVSSPRHESCNTPGCATPDAYAMQIFMLLPANNETPLNVLQTTIQSPSPIQPTTSATILPPTKQVTPLPLALPIAGLVMMGILRFIQRKKLE